jgi:hypothetical protein
MALTLLTVALGGAFFPQVYGLLPRVVFYSLLGGWVAYVVAAVAMLLGRKEAFPAVFLLAVLTLAASLPQPEHYALVSGGIDLASITFIAGTALQVVLLVMIPVYLLRRRRRNLTVVRA